MKLLLTFLFVLSNAVTTLAQSARTEIMIVGSDHFSQTYKKGNPNTDVLTPTGQQGMTRFTSSVARYKPDMLVIESLPEKQAEIDSLYLLYVQDKLNLLSLPDSRSEVYQLAFRLGKQLQLPRIYCVNAPGGTSQSILRNGDNIEVYQNATTELRKVVAEVTTALQNGTLPLYDYLVTINQPRIYNMVYRLRYMTPARVTNGRFVNPDSMVDTAFVNPKYIGAELISVFKNRDYKIYSNIVVRAMQVKPKRIVALFGAAHIGSLNNIFIDDPEYRVMRASKYLKK